MVQAEDVGPVACRPRRQAVVGQLLACRRTAMSSHPMRASFGRRRV